MDSLGALKEFGALIRKARVQAGMTQLSLGVELGFESGQFISTLERGLRTLPAKHIQLFSNSLQLDENEIVSRLIQIHSLRIKERIGQA